MALPIVEKNVPIPEHLKHGASKSRSYGYERLEVGDSIFFEGKTEAAIRQSFGNYRSWAKLPNWQAVCTIDTLNGKEGVRMWRVADAQPKEKSKEEKQYERIQGGKGWKEVLREGDPG